MENLDWSRASWETTYDWSTGGEEWSECWGGSEPQWFGALYPRLHRLLPANTILEIAPGFGRWTQFLLPLCRRYQGVDISQTCVDACKNRFSQVKHARFARNDGRTLAGIEDGTCDLVFSFDSLVHSDLDVLESYFPEILRVLSPDGVAFIHHSNLAALGDTTRVQDRSTTVSAANAAAAIAAAGGSVVIQETVDWGVDQLVDCITLFCRRRDGLKPRMIENHRFMNEASTIKDVHAEWLAAITGTHTMAT